MKKFISQDGEAFTISSHPVKVNGVECEAVTLTKAQQDKLDGGKYNVTRADNKLSFTLIPEDPSIALKKDLKAKLEAGTAIQEDIENALKLLL